MKAKLQNVPSPGLLLKMEGKQTHANQGNKTKTKKQKNQTPLPSPKQIILRSKFSGINVQ